MQARATYDDARLIIELYETRREERMRKARAWFAGSFRPKTLDDFAALCPPGSDENASYRMVTTYWEMVASFVTSGVLNQELFFQSGRELLLVWERMRDILPALAREELRRVRLHQPRDGRAGLHRVSRSPQSGDVCGVLGAPARVAHNHEAHEGHEAHETENPGSRTTVQREPARSSLPSTISSCVAPEADSPSCTRSTSGSATWTPNSTAPCATPRCRASARSCGKPAALSTDARLPATCPAASPSSAASGPAATSGPIPGITKAIAASTWPPSSPRRAAARESSRSTPGVASIRSARVRASA